MNWLARLPERGNDTFMKGARQTAGLVTPVTSQDHIRGPTGAPVTLVEYGDFECPACGRAYPVTKALLAQMPDALRFVYRHFPLVTLHPHAATAAQAAEAAGAQGRFWEMHDVLFEHQDALEMVHLRVYALAIGLDIDRFDADMLSGRWADRAQEDFRSGRRSGVEGTPTFFVGGVRHTGSHDLRSMLAALRAAAPGPRSRQPGAAARHSRH